ncbi:hypothetical protein LTR17_027695 [Elasticomyces elasticus]|nr:hypothetical protein LTR17_027695 [Elasticomyces elasticus]
MAEETQDASVNVPRGTIGSYPIGTVSGLIYAQATGSDSGTLTLTAILIILTFFSATNFMASASRQTYAFARDGGLPFSVQIAKVSERLNVPILACIIAFAFVVLLSLITLGSYVAFYAIIYPQLIALFFTYEVVVGHLSIAAYADLLYRNAGGAWDG